MECEIDVLLIGHLTVDLAPGGPVLGGTVSYAAPTYAAFGRRVGVLTSAAYNEDLLKHLLPHCKLIVRPALKSLTYENIYNEHGRQQYVRATAQAIQYGDVPVGWVGAPYVHLGPLAGEIDAREFAANFPNATIMLTLQGLMRRWDGDGLVRFRPWFQSDVLKLIDIVVFSEEDILHYPQLKDDFRRVCRHLVVTNGRAGGAYYHDGGVMHYDSLEVQPRDLTGAGDVFAASLLGALQLLKGDVSQAVRLAGKLAAYSVTRSSLDSAPTQAEIEIEASNLT